MSVKEHPAHEITLPVSRIFSRSTASGQFVSYQPVTPLFERLHSSGKDATMDKEMKAKIDEILKANSRRELSMDEMDKVSGGACYDRISHH